MKNNFYGWLIAILLFPACAFSQVDGDQTGAWYMFFWNKPFENSNLGFQGDYQFRYWDFGSDQEQLLLRSGLTLENDAKTIKGTLGYGYIRTGAFGDSKETVVESRIYQEALIPTRVSDRFQLTHRFRFEQRWVENQDFRIRWRYNLFLNIPLNNTRLTKGTWYLAFYNEIFINGNREIGDGRLVELFDRNRSYAAVGFGLFQNHRVQFGLMRQTTNAWAKTQMQLSLHSTL